MLGDKDITWSIIFFFIGAGAVGEAAVADGDSLGLGAATAFMRFRLVFNQLMNVHAQMIEKMIIAAMIASLPICDEIKAVKPERAAVGAGADVGEGILLGLDVGDGARAS
jgi:hypothetical protein